jgi:hypothetical protein
VADAEIMGCIFKAIPNVQDQSTSSLSIITNMIDSDGYLIKPIGTIVSSYTKEINVSSTTVLAVGTSTEGVKAETTFILTLANGKSPGVNE